MKIGGLLIIIPKLKTEEVYSADIYPWRYMSAQHLTRDICLFQGGHTHMQSELLQETGAKKACGRRGGAGGGNPQGMPLWLPPAIAWLHDQ